MATDVASFARQLKQQGIDAARQEADTIIGSANSKADEIVKEGQAAVAKMQQDARDEIARHRQRSEAELKLVARDLILNVKQQVEQVAALLLKEKVGQALSSEEVVKSALVELVKCQKNGKEWELALGPSVGKSLAETIVEDLFKSDAAVLKLTDGFNKVGFQLRTTSGTEVIEVSDDSVSDAFRRLLSPELQKILDSRLETAG